jgi:hypothetical protein
MDRRSEDVGNMVLILSPYIPPVIDLRSLEGKGTGKVNSNHDGAGRRAFLLIRNH